MKKTIFAVALITALSGGSALAAELPTTPVLNLETAQAILSQAERLAAENNAPASIVVADTAGIPLSMLRMDDASGASAEIALQKARTAALFKRPTQNFEDAINGARPAAITGNFVMMSGGLPIEYQGKVVGAIGVSSPSPAMDVTIASGAIGILVDE